MDAPPPGAGTAGPSPETLGLATLLAAVVGGGFMLLMFRRRRRQPSGPAPVAARVAAPPPRQERWTNVRLDENETLPPWLRALSEPERAPLSPAAATYVAESGWDPVPDAPAEWNTATDWSPASEPPVAFPQPEPVAAEEMLPARAPATFADPLSDGAMRLAIGSDRTELLDQPGDFGVVLATLVAGDEVEIQDIAEPWIRVVTALGSTGWIRSASLGFGMAVDASGADEVHDAPAAAAPKPKRRAPRMPRRSRSPGTAS